MNRQEYNTNRPRIQCDICGRFITKANYEIHRDACIRNQGKSNKIYQVVHHKYENELICEFCGKQHKSLNSLAQHEIRCPKNPDRKDFNKLGDYSHKNFKGQTKETCETIRKVSETVKNKYKQGYISPLVGRCIEFTYVHEKHNEEQIGKWLQYVRNKNLVIPKFNCHNHTEGYRIITSKIEGREFNTSYKFVFEHDLIIEYVLGRELDSENVVHHLNRNRLDNNINNLIVFKTKSDHVRYHTTKYAYLVYDDTTNLFSCFKVIPNISK